MLSLYFYNFFSIDEITFNKAVAKVVLEKKDFSQQIGTFGKLNYISCDAPEVVLARAFTMLKLHGEINDEGNLLSMTF